MADIHSHPRFLNEHAAYDWVEVHLRPNGPVSAHAAVDWIGSPSSRARAPASASTSARTAASPSP